MYLKFLHRWAAAQLAGALWKMSCAAESHGMKRCGFRIVLQEVFKQMKLLWWCLFRKKVFSSLHQSLQSLSLLHAELLAFFLSPFLPPLSCTHRGESMAGLYSAALSRAEKHEKIHFTTRILKTTNYLMSSWKPQTVKQKTLIPLLFSETA